MENKDHNGVLPADQENLSSIHEEIDRLVNLSSDLKDLNVAEMGALKLSLIPVDLNHLLDKVIHSLHPLIQEKELTLNLNVPEEPVTTSGDERLLTRLFYNLVHNAYQYTENGGLVSVTLTQTSNVTEVRILNTGIGISEEDLPFIFERFYRADKSRTRETGGTGIGLALVYQITTLHRLPNLITGKGMFREIRRSYPQANRTSRGIVSLGKSQSIYD